MKLHRIGSVYLDYFVVRDLDGVAVTGLAQGDFSVRLYRNGSPSAVPVAIGEAGDGAYYATFTPDAAGAWLLHLWQTAEPLRRWQATLEATADGPATPGGTADAILDRAGAIDGATPRDALRRIAAATAGRCAITGPEVTFLGLDGTTPRVVAQTTPEGERPAVDYP